MTDTWNGAPLPERRVAATPDIHYRIYAPSGALLSFGSTNSLTALAADVIATQAEHPGVRLTVQQFDGPAY